MVIVDRVTKQFGDVRAVNGLSFEVKQGEILGFLGPNGAGKTTTMRILTCFFPPTSGSATVAGFDVTREPNEVRRALGYMPEGVPLYRDMTVTEFLEFVGQAKGISAAKRRAGIDQAIGETNLGEVRHRLIGQLSKGTRQRVGLAQAVLGEPKVLILDEPTVGLDPKQIAEIRELVLGMKGRRTVIISTHILPEVQMTCDRVLILNRGQIVFSGTPATLTATTEGQTAVEVELATDAGTAEPLLKKVPAVTAVTLLSARAGQSRFRITGSGGDKFCADVAAAIVGQNIGLLELRTVGKSLEEAVIEAVSGEATGKANQS